MILVSSTEPAPLRELGTTSWSPERYGADVMWHQKGVGLIGVQRKCFPSDFLASLGDRLPRQIGQMAKLSIAVLVLEGRGTWTTDGHLVHGWGQAYTRSQHRRYLCSVRARGIWVETTDNLDDTISFLTDLQAWAAKPKHQSLLAREGPSRNGWGKVSTKAAQLHLIQGIDGVGPELAERILEKLGMPLQLSVSRDDLIRVHGVGEKTADRIVKAFK